MKLIKWLFVVLSISTTMFVSAQSYEFSKTYSVHFPNNSPNKVSYIVFPDVYLCGYLKITVTGGFYNELSMGELSKTIAIFKASSSTIGNQSAQVTEAFGPVASNISIGDFNYTTRRIPIFHLTSAEDVITIKVEGLFEHSQFISTILSQTTVTTPTTGTITQPKQYKSIMQDRLGINTINPLFTLDVNGTIHAKEVRVDLSGADFVFDESYNLMPLEELESFVNKNKHLPEIAPARDMQENGASVGELNSKLIQKVEELTLYLIQQNKEISNLNLKIIELQKK